MSLSTPALASSSGNEATIDGLIQEFARYGTKGTQSTLQGIYSTACESGDSVACKAAEWIAGKPITLVEAAERVASECEVGNSTACMLVGWAIDEQAKGTNRASEQIRAARIFRDHCELGFLPACHEYGTYLLHNQELSANPRHGVKRLQTACGKGYQPSCTSVAKLYAKGEVLSKNKKRAMQMAKSSCESGSHEGCYMLAQWAGGSWDEQTLDSWFGNLCDEGYAQSCWTLAALYLSGTIPEPEQGRSYLLLVEGCKSDHAPSCREAGRAYFSAEGGDLEAGATLYRKSCRLGDTAACVGLTQHILKGDIAGNIADDYDGFEHACAIGEDVPACTSLATALLHGTEIDMDSPRGRALLADSCQNETSYSESCYQLGGCFANGQGGEKDRTQAAQYYDWACAQGHTLSCYAQGELLISGNGVLKDPKIALERFQQACELGSKDGCMRSADLLHTGNDAPTAVTLYRQLCDDDDAVACLKLALLFEQGASGVEIQDFEAREAYAHAVDGGAKRSSLEFARFLWNNKRIRIRNRGKARRLAKDACQQGDAKACLGPEFL